MEPQIHHQFWHKYKNTKIQIQIQIQSKNCKKIGQPLYCSATASPSSSPRYWLWWSWSPGRGKHRQRRLRGRKWNLVLDVPGLAAGSHLVLSFYSWWFFISGSKIQKYKNTNTNTKIPTVNDYQMLGCRLHRSALEEEERFKSNSNGCKHCEILWFVLLNPFAW